MRKSILLMILAAVVLFTAGCTEMPGNSTGADIGKEKITVVKITQLEQINTSLQKGPVFLKLGSRWCPHCRAMAPILENLTAKYNENATIASVDVDQNPELAEYFKVDVIPDSCVIVDIENGKYVYIQENGNVSTDRSQAKKIGLSDGDEKLFEKIMNIAIVQFRK